MLPGLQVGFGALIDPAILAEVRRRGVQVVRQQLYATEPPFPGVDAGLARELVQQITDADLRPLIIIREPAQVNDVPPGVDIEVGNEPDIAGFGWREGNGGSAAFPAYRDAVLAVVERAGGRNPVWVGSASNFNERGFAFLAGLPWREIPAWVGCSMHRYPDGAHGPTRSHMRTGLRRWTRDQEVEHLRRIAGPRPLAITETGYNGIDYPEPAQARHMAWERDFWTRHGFAYAVAYQINSGPADGRTRESYYGARRADGSWRPWLGAWTGVGEDDA